MESIQPSSAFMKTKVWLDDEILCRLNATTEEEKASAVKEICIIAQDVGLSVSNSSKDPFCIEGTLSGINVLQQAVDTVVSKLDGNSNEGFVRLLKATLTEIGQNDENVDFPPTNNVNGEGEGSAAVAATSSEPMSTDMGNFDKQFQSFMEGMNIELHAGSQDYNHFMKNFMLAYQSFSKSAVSQAESVGTEENAEIEGKPEAADEQSGASEGKGEGDGGKSETKEENSEIKEEQFLDQNVMFPNLKQIVDMMKKRAKSMAQQTRTRRKHSRKPVAKRTMRNRYVEKVKADDANLVKGEVDAEDHEIEEHEEVGIYEDVPDDVMDKEDPSYGEGARPERRSRRKRKPRKVKKVIKIKSVKKDPAVVPEEKPGRGRGRGRGRPGTMAAMLKGCWTATPLGLKCNECDFVTANKLNVHEHIMRNHRERSRFCEVCHKAYGTARDLRRHMRSHRNPYPCEKCGKMYRTDRGIKEHLKTHEDGYVKPQFPCEVCGQVLSTPYVLQVHMDKAHRGIDHKTHMCEFCGKAFSNKHILLEHRNTHTGDTPFKCNVCGEGFTYTGAVRIHKRKVHNIGTKKTYQCNICFKFYQCSSGLRTHQKLHGGTPQFRCETCGRAFFQKGTMQRHMRTHTGERPFKCELCQSSFSDTSILRRHMMGRHKMAYINKQRGRARNVPDHPSDDYLKRKAKEEEIRQMSAATLASVATAAVFGSSAPNYKAIEQIVNSNTEQNSKPAPLPVTLPEPEPIQSPPPTMVPSSMHQLPMVQSPPAMHVSHDSMQRSMAMQSPPPMPVPNMHRSMSMQSPPPMHTPTSHHRLDSVQSPPPLQSPAAHLYGQSSMHVSSGMHRPAPAESPVMHQSSSMQRPTPGQSPAIMHQSSSMQRPPSVHTPTTMHTAASSLAATGHYIPPGTNFAGMPMSFMHDGYLYNNLPSYMPESHHAPVTLDPELMRRMESQYMPPMMGGARSVSTDGPVPAHSHHHQQTFTR